MTTHRPQLVPRSRKCGSIHPLPDRLCGLVVRVHGYRSGGPVRFPALPDFSVGEKKRKTVVGLDRGPLSLVSTTEELLDRKVAAPVWKTENTAVGIRHADYVAPSICKSWQSLPRQAAVARSLGRYSSLADSDHGVFFLYIHFPIRLHGLVLK
jgi:hypothetical protein